MGKINTELFNERQKELLKECKDFWRSPAGKEAIRNTTTWEDRNGEQ